MKKQLFCLVLCLFIGCTMLGCGSSSPQQEKEPLTLTMPEDGHLRIAQFADFHFGTEGEDYHNADEERTIQFMDHIVETTQPDLIVLSGDNIMSSGVEGMKKLVSLMDKYQIPWTLIWGNHDTIAGSLGYSKKDLSSYLDTCGSSYLMYQEDYIEKGTEDRYGNFAISVLDSTEETLLGAILLMDSGTYDYSLGGYQSITEGQITWYTETIASLQETYAKQENTPHSIVPSIVFAHIPLPEHTQGYVYATEENGATFVTYQDVSSRFIDIVKNSSPLNDTHFFDTLKEVGSTRAYFVGHMHSLRYQIQMDDILLGFGPQTGFAKMGSSTTSKRVSYVYEVGEDFTIDTIECWEP